jgi:hypothetical protein
MRKCPRTLDKPILLLGLELEDLGLLALAGGGGGLLFGPVIPGIAAIVGWVMLVRFKRDKPQGYLLHYLYAKGLELPGLLPPVNKFRFYGAYVSHNISKLSVS